MIQTTQIFPFAALFTCLIFGCDSKISKSSREKSFVLTRQADSLLKENKLDSAEKVISAALKLDPDNYIAYNDRAYLGIQVKRPEADNIKDLKKAIELRPEYNTGLYSQANYYFQIRDYKNALNISGRYLSLQLGEDLNSNLLGNLYFLTGVSERHLLQFDNAIIDLKKAIEIDPQDKVSHYELANCFYYGKNDIASATIEFTKALNIDSTFSAAYYGREKCDRNSKPPLIPQAVRDSTKAEKYDTANKSIPDTLYDAFEKYRKSINPDISKASALYDSVISWYRPNKVVQQKVIDNLVLTIQGIKNDNKSIVDSKSLRSIADDAILSNTFLLDRLNSIQEVDSTINLKKKLIDYVNLFQDVMINKMPTLLVILGERYQNRVAKTRTLLEPTFILIKKNGIEFHDAEQALMDKYSLH
jgi:tetratricopeptide (TPR) repeat protein